MNYREDKPFQALPMFYNITVTVVDEEEITCSEIWGFKVLVSIIEGATKGLHKRQWRNYVTAMLHDVIRQENIYVEDINDDPIGMWLEMVDLLNERLVSVGIQVDDKQSCLLFVKGVNIYDKNRTVWDLEILHGRDDEKSRYSYGAA